MAKSIKTKVVTDDPNIYERWLVFAAGKKTLREARPDIFLKFKFPDYFKDFATDKKTLWVFSIRIPCFAKLKELIGIQFDIKHFEGREIEVKNETYGDYEPYKSNIEKLNV